MMPELGKYAVEVLAGYGVTLGLLAALALRSFRRHSRLQSQLAETERRAGR